MRHPGRVVLVLGMAVALAQAGCKRLPWSSAGGSDDLPAGAVPLPSATPAPPVATAPAPVVVSPPVSPSGQSAPMSFAPIAKRVDASVVTIVILR